MIILSLTIKWIISCHAPAHYYHNVKGTKGAGDFLATMGAMLVVIGFVLVNISDPSSSSDSLSDSPLESFWFSATSVDGGIVGGGGGGGKEDGDQLGQGEREDIFTSKKVANQQNYQQTYLYSEKKEEGGGFGNESDEKSPLL